MEPRILDTRLKQYNDITKQNDQLYRGVAKKFGLSECAFWILYYLRADYGEAKQSEICSSFHQPKQSIHSALKKLEAEGYIALTAGGNRRSKGIVLTAEGRRLCEETVDYVIEAEKSALGSLSEEEQEELMNLYNRYTKQFKLNMRAMPEKGGNIT